MSNDKSIFEPEEGFASGPPARSPFAADESPSNPFASGSPGKSPFAVDTTEPAFKPESVEKATEPFGASEEKSPFGYEPPVAGFGESPFEGSSSPKSESPFGVAEESKPKESPHGDSRPAPVASPAAAAAMAAAASIEAPSKPSDPSPAPASTAAGFEGFESDSASIRQLELRAIFGVDREMNEDEILKRSRALPGIRHLARMATQDAGAVDAIKRVLGSLGFGGGQVKLYCGSAPIEFIRENQVLLAVQTDGGFAPGVRETLMIVARELGRM